MSASQENIRLIGPGQPAAETVDGLSWVMALDDQDSTRDVIDALALAPFARGEQPYARSIRLERVKPDAPLRPAAGRLVRSAGDDDGSGTVLAVGTGWTLRA